MSPSDKIAMASIIVGGVLGLAGILVTFVGGWRDRRSTRELALEERRQQRLADAYVEVLDQAERVGHWAAMVRPVVDTMPPRSPPPLPSLDSQAHVRALTNAFGSQAVRDRIDEWDKCVQEILRADMLIGFGLDREAQTGIDYLSKWQELDETLRPRERKLRQQLADEISKELGHRSKD